MLKKLAAAALVLALAVPAYAQTVTVPPTEPIPTTAKPVSKPKAPKKVEKKADKKAEKKAPAEAKADAPKQ